jgi:hypothetical protein
MLPAVWVPGQSRVLVKMTALLLRTHPSALRHEGGGGNETAPTPFLPHPHGEGRSGGWRPARLYGPAV